MSPPGRARQVAQRVGARVAVGGRVGRPAAADTVGHEEDRASEGAHPFIVPTAGLVGGPRSSRVRRTAAELPGIDAVNYRLIRSARGLSRRVPTVASSVEATRLASSASPSRKRATAGALERRAADQVDVDRRDVRPSR